MKQRNYSHEIFEAKHLYHQSYMKETFFGQTILVTNEMGIVKT